MQTPSQSHRILSPITQEKSCEVIINVIDIQKGRLIAEIRAGVNKKNQHIKMQSRKYERLVNQITYVFYDEQRHEVVTGHENGSVIIWN